MSSLNKKLCSGCENLLEFKDFSKHKGRPDGLQAYCRACMKLQYDKIDKSKRNSYYRAWRKNNHKHKSRLDEYKKRHPEMLKGIAMLKYWPNVGWRQALKNYLDLLKLQNNGCAICGKAETRVDKRNGKVKDLAVDHCHLTGKVRGLLCDAHNTAIGLFSVDNGIELLEKAILYYATNH